MQVHVKLTKDDDWQEVKVVGFYDPKKHHTVRLDGNPEKTKYYQMKMPDGRVYDKDIDKWILSKPDTEDIVLTKYVKKLPYENGSVRSIKLEKVLCRADDLVTFMKECHRVLAVRGILTTSVYLFPSVNSYSDPEIKNYFAEDTFGYFRKGSRYDLFSKVDTLVRGDYIQVTLKK